MNESKKWERVLFTVFLALAVSLFLALECLRVRQTSALVKSKQREECSCDLCVGDGSY